eukprot:TRINITY_DN11138_c0_g1_i3.p1 TRINITY_DN11138_c0_g1~~TRINITY_DN11138_c0_g1_i3.p1  ORF type:complete len:154 (-),score=40.37 TRINITY_DN11138_c0_g1_i3:308-706(-)
MAASDHQPSLVVYHYHYCSWPDMGVPTNGLDLLGMMQVADEKQKQISASSPTLVHCSAGLGRTGTYILIHTSLSYAQERKTMELLEIPIKDIILRLREQRHGMIQTREQYIFGVGVVKDSLAVLKEAAEGEL